MSIRACARVAYWGVSSLFTSKQATQVKPQASDSTGIPAVDELMRSLARDLIPRTPPQSQLVRTPVVHTPPHPLPAPPRQRVRFTVAATPAAAPAVNALPRRPALSAARARFERQMAAVPPFPERVQPAPTQANTSSSVFGCVQSVCTSLPSSLQRVALAAQLPFAAYSVVSAALNIRHRYQEAAPQRQADQVVRTAIAKTTHPERLVVAFNKMDIAAEKKDIVETIKVLRAGKIPAGTFPQSMPLSEQQARIQPLIRYVQANRQIPPEMADFHAQALTEKLNAKLERGRKEGEELARRPASGCTVQ